MYNLCMARCSWDEPGPTPFGFPQSQSPQGPMPLPTVQGPNVSGSYMEGRRQQQQYELMELERQRMQLELQAAQKARDDEAWRRDLQQRAAATAATLEAQAAQSETTTLSCTFSGDARDNTPTRGLVKTPFKPAPTVMMQVEGNVVSLRSNDGWVPAPSDIRDDAFQVEGQFLSLPDTGNGTGGGPVLPSASRLVVDRYSGFAVIFTHPDAANGTDIPSFPGSCRPAERQF
jgi:hypothetical protein